MLPGSAAGSLKVLANEFINIAVTDTPSEKSTEISAIYLRGVFEGAVSDNAISAVGTNSPLANGHRRHPRRQQRRRAGERQQRSQTSRPRRNSRTPASGMLVVGPIVNVEIADNLIKRQILPHDNDGSPWQAIRIAGLSGQQAAPSSFVALNADSPAGQVNSISTFAAAAAPANEQAGHHRQLAPRLRGQAVGRSAGHGQLPFQRQSLLRRSTKNCRRRSPSTADVIIAWKQSDRERA